MFKRIDQSSFLARFIAFISEFLAKRRGLPVILGIALVIVSLVVQLIDVYAESKLLHLVGILSQSLGIIIALIGLLLSEPLGK
ncbi:MAG: hypothetical protein ABI690_07395 [Chloroflexota bacterium]